MNKILLIYVLLASLSFSNGIKFYNNNLNNNLSLNKTIKKESKKIRKDIKNLNKIIILKKAKELMGKKYVFGAKVGDLNNFDCSSFVKALYKEIGVELPRVSKEQSKIGKKISINDLEIGDLIFFNTLGNYISHVGIYIGNGKFIHASSKAKKTVVSNFEGYYKEKAVYGTRIGV